MTEDEWDACTDPQEMLRACGALSDRKLRLFVAACCRRVWHMLLNESSRRAVEAAEGYADGLVAEAERHDAAAAATPTNAAFGMSLRAADETGTPQDSAARYPAATAGFAAGSAAWAAAACCEGHSRIAGSPGPLQAPGFVADAVGTMAASRATAERPDLPSYEAAVEVGSGHLNAAQAEEQGHQAALLRDIVANPFAAPPRIDPAWLTWSDGTIPRLAEAAYQERVLPSGELDKERHAVLADALEEVGADDLLLGHLRRPGPRVRGDWLIDILTGRE